MADHQRLPFHHLLSLVFDQPLDVLPSKLAVVLDVLSEKTGMSFVLCDEDDSGDTPQIILGSIIDKSQRDSKPYYVDAHGTATIPIQGTLVNRNGTIRPSSGMFGYDGVRALSSRATADPDVKRIALDIDSGGGHSYGMLSCADDLARCAAAKPMLAIVNNSAYSAAYGLACAASRIVIPRDGGVGSVGTIAAHVDRSKELENKGQHVTLIYAGQHKADFVQVAPLTESAKDAIRTRVLSHYKEFCTMVGERRGLEPSAVAAMESQTYRGQDAVDIGLADEVVDTDAVLQNPEQFFPSGKTTVLMPRDVGNREDTMNHLKELCALVGIEPGADEAATTKLLSDRITALTASEKTMALVCKKAEVENADALMVHLGSVVSVKELEAVKQTALETRAEQFVNQLMNREGGNKLMEADREWALGKFKSDEDGFREFMKNAPSRTPSSHEAGAVDAPPAGPTKTVRQKSDEGLSADEKAALIADGYTVEQVAAADAKVRAVDARDSIDED